MDRVIDSSARSGEELWIRQPGRLRVFLRYPGPGQDLMQTGLTPIA